MCSSHVALEHSKSISMMQTNSAQMDKDLTLHPQDHGRRTQWHKNSFIYESIPIWIYLSYNFSWCSGTLSCGILKTYFGILTYLELGQMWSLAPDQNLTYGVVWNPRLGFVFKLNNTRILQAVLARAQLYLVATWAAEALNKVSNACLTFTSMIRSLVKKKKIRLFLKPNWNIGFSLKTKNKKNGHRFVFISGN